MFPNLFAELGRQGMSLKRLSELAEIQYPSLLNKVNGKTEFTRKEMVEIKRILAPSLSLDILFAAADQTA